MAIGRVLAVDYGQKRTGLAVCDPLGIIASPLTALVTEDLEETVQGIVRHVQERDVRIVLVGMPFLPDGREGAQVQIVRLFLGALRAALPANVGLLERDERHTTHEANSLLREGGFNRRRAKEHVDSVAAVVILREYLQEMDRPGPPPDETRGDG